jgi:hypothetical protein
MIDLVPQPRNFLISFENLVIEGVLLLSGIFLKLLATGSDLIDFFSQLLDLELVVEDEVLNSIFVLLLHGLDRLGLSLLHDAEFPVLNFLEIVDHVLVLLLENIHLVFVLLQLLLFLSVVGLPQAFLQFSARGNMLLLHLFDAALVLSYNLVVLGHPFLILLLALGLLLAVFLRCPLELLLELHLQHDLFLGQILAHLLELEVEIRLQDLDFLVLDPALSTKFVAHFIEINDFEPENSISSESALFQ